MRYFIFLFMLLLALNACKKEGDIPPQLDLPRVTRAGVNNATVVNKIIGQGSSPITVSGTCWSSTNQALTLENSGGYTINKPHANGEYTDSLTGLVYNQKYYIRAYATNAAGTSYSVVDSFYTLQSPYNTGQLHSGGSILAIDSTGMHGIIAALPKYIVSLPWSNSYGSVGGTFANFGKGQANTERLVATLANPAGTAALYCQNLVAEGYDDWFLPSYEELWYFRNNMSFMQWLQYPFDMYWTSTETNASTAYFVVMGGGASFNNYDKLIGKTVLPMRKF
jgi:hypothetical protein